MDTGCYHIWKSAATGNALFRVERCYHSRAAVNAAITRWRAAPPTRERKDRDGNPVIDPRTGQPRMARPPASAVMMALKCHGVDDDTAQVICPCPCAAELAAAVRERRQAA